MKIIRKLLALIIGVPIVVLGIILVPLPGPGLLVMFAGLFIISLEFEWAQKYVDQIRDKFSDIIKDARRRTDGSGKDTDNKNR